jgi:hypothetical protein
MIISKKYDRTEWESKIKEACETSLTMREASSKLPMHGNTFAKMAKEIGCYTPNQGGKGTRKYGGNKGYKLQDILEGKHPGYNNHRLKQRLIREGVKEHRCENCNLTHWIDDLIPLELHHIDGNSSNHLLINLKLLCPNCHALTDNYRALKKCRD